MAKQESPNTDDPIFRYAELKPKEFTPAIGENVEPLAENTKLCCMFLYPSITLGKDFFNLKINEHKTVKFYCLYPLYKEEMDFKLKNSADTLIDKFEKYNIRDVIDINRRNTCINKGFLGLW